MATKKKVAKAATKKGRRLTDEQIEQVIALYAATGSITRTAKEMGISKSTVSRWTREPEYAPKVQQARTEKRVEFAKKAGDIINKSLKLLDRRITTALEHEEALDELLFEVAHDKDIKGPTRDALIAKIKGLQVQKVSEITTAIGTLYDKRALAKGESTNNTTIGLSDADRALLEKVTKRLDSGGG